MYIFNIIVYVVGKTYAYHSCCYIHTNPDVWNHIVWCTLYGATAAQVFVSRPELSFANLSHCVSWFEVVSTSTWVEFHSIFRVGKVRNKPDSILIGHIPGILPQAMSSNTSSIVTDTVYLLLPRKHSGRERTGEIFKRICFHPQVDIVFSNISINRDVLKSTQIKWSVRCNVSGMGIEPAALSLLTPWSNQLSYPDHKPLVLLYVISKPLP